jgi:CRP-like cAMP-binding protein
MQSDLEALRRTSFFRSLPEDSLARLAMHVVHRHYDADQLIFEQDSPGQGLFIIADGEVKISVTTPNRPEIILAMLGSGEAFGELALIDDAKRSASATATKFSTLLYLNRSDFQATIEGEPIALRAILHELAAVIRNMNERLGDVVILDVHARMAKLLMEDLAEFHQVAADGKITIQRNFSFDELASRVYMHPLQVENLMRDYQYDYILTRDAEKQIVILQPEVMRGWTSSA